MNGASVKALVALIPMSVFFAGSVCISSFFAVVWRNRFTGRRSYSRVRSTWRRSWYELGIKGQHRPLSRFAVRYRWFRPVSGWVFDARGEDVCRRES
jgi:hypothetical protein